MADEPAPRTDPLPLIPQEVLKKHHVFEPLDNRFRACARLLQALWREYQGLPIGSYRPHKGRLRRIGSLIGDDAARDGRNFMSPDVAQWVHRELAYRERGALIDRRRLMRNLLSSAPLTANLFAPLRFDLRLAADVLRNLAPEVDIAKVLDVLFEHSPSRNDLALTGDRTAFDVAFIYERRDGERGFIGIEVKFSETMGDNAPAELRPEYDALADSSGLFKAPMAALLRVNPCQQLFREHLLAQAALIRGDFAEATFVLVAPRDNHLVQRGAAIYAAHLVPPVTGQVAFRSVELEQVIEAIGWAGQPDYAFALFDRYLNWFKIDEVVGGAIQADRKNWDLIPPPRAGRAHLISAAAE